MILNLMTLAERLLETYVQRIVIEIYEVLGKLNLKIIKFNSR